jgi:hypothetical protein
MLLSVWMVSLKKAVAVVCQVIAADWGSEGNRWFIINVAASLGLHEKSMGL